MNKQNPKIDLYLSEGCGRCPLGGTPQCKVHDWQPELKRLRKIALGCGLTEELKWSVPCYTFEKRNIVVIAAFKEFCSLSFFKGVLLADPQSLLEAAGENSRSARLIRFNSVAQIKKLEPVLQAYLVEAIAIEQRGQKVDFAANDTLTMPDELQKKFAEMPELEIAFRTLTPGRQRGYLLHFSGAKQSKTRESRIEKCVSRILAGRGMHD